jgi:hypothetical protein
MLRGVGGWHTPDNIDADLQGYENKWLNKTDGAKRRRGLFALLQLVRDGTFDDESAVA